MSQVFVPTVGISGSSQATAQQGAQVNTAIPQQLNPLNDLKYFNQISDTVAKGFNQWDQLEMRANLQKAQDDLQTQYSANRDELFTRKGKAALDYKNVYEQNNKKITQNALNNVTDPRLRGLVKDYADQTQAQYQISANGYFKQETARMGLNQAQASVASAAGNYIDQLSAGTPEQQKTAEQQFDIALRIEQYYEGIDPNGVDGKMGRITAKDEIMEAINNHNIAHKTFANARAALDYFKNKTTSAAWLKASDKLYLAEQKENGTSSAAANGYKLGNKPQWVKTRADDLFNAWYANATKEERDDAQIVGIKRQDCILKANQAYDEMANQVDALSNTDAAFKNLVSQQIAYAQQSGMIFGTNVRIDPNVLSDPNRALDLLPDDTKHALLAQKGTVKEATKFLIDNAEPLGGSLAGIDIVNRANSDPTFFDQFPTEQGLRAYLHKNGVGIKDSSEIIKLYNSDDRVKALNTRITNVLNRTIMGINPDLLVEKELKKGSNALIADLYRKKGKQVVQDLLKANPNINDDDLIVQVFDSLKTDRTLMQQAEDLNNIDDRLKAVGQFNEEIENLSPELKEAVIKYDPMGVSAAMAGDTISSAERFMQCVNNALKNDHFLKAYPNIDEVKEALAYKRKSADEVKRFKNSPYGNVILQTMIDMGASQEEIDQYTDNLDLRPFGGVNGGDTQGINKDGSEAE